MKKLLALLLLLLAAPAWALGPYPGDQFVTDGQGNGLAAIVVTVYLAGTTTEADLYSDNGVTPIANPMTTDYRGHFMFWAANGSYDICYSGSGVEPWCDLAVKIIDENQVGAPWLNITEARFGAVSGDGVDDLAALQAVADAIAAAGDGIMYIPAGGTFLISDRVTITSKITITGGGTITKTDAHNDWAFYANGVDGITVSGITIDGNGQRDVYNGSGSQGAFGLYQCQNVLVENCTMYDLDSDCVYIGRSSDSALRPENVTISNNRFLRARRDGVAVIDCVNLVISGNTLIDIYGQAIDLEPNLSAYYSLGIDGATITGNVSYCSIPPAKAVDGWLPNALGIDFKAGSGGTLDCHGSGIVVTGNSFEYADPDPAAGDDGTRRPPQVIISSAGYHYNPGGSMAVPVVFSDNIVRSNTVSGFASYGLVSFRDFIDPVITGNQIIGSDEVQNTNSTEAGDWGVYNGLEVNGPPSQMWYPIIDDNRIQGNFRHQLFVADTKGAKIGGTLIHTGADQNTACLYMGACGNPVVTVQTYGGSDYGARVQGCWNVLFAPGTILGAVDRAMAFTTTASDSVTCIGVISNQTDNAGFGSNALDRTGTVNGFHEVYTIHAPSLP